MSYSKSRTLIDLQDGASEQTTAWCSFVVDEKKTANKDSCARNLVLCKLFHFVQVHLSPTSPGV